MKKFLLLLATATLAMFVGCGESGMDKDIIEEIEDNYNEVLLDGKNISGVWAKVGDSLESDLVECMVEEVVIIDGETINYHNATKQNGFGFKDNYLFDCTLDDFVFETSALFNLVGNKLYIAGFYSCDLELEGTALYMIYENKIEVLKKVTGFKEYKFPSSGKTEESGLPVPLNNEIYYRTSDGEPLDIELFNTSLSHTYSKEDDYGRVVFAEDLTSIGNTAFYECSNLASITISDSVTSIGNGAFFGCSSLASITIPEGVTSIGEQAFYYCSSLTSVTIPDSVTDIGDSAFYGCTSLTSVTLPDGVTSIGGRAFSGCTSLTSITLPNGVTSIGYMTFEDCSSLTSITIPDSVTSIGVYAFYNCTSLTSITLPDGITKIESNAFYFCKSLTSVTIPDGVTEIGELAFGGCTSLTSVTIPDSVDIIGMYAFNYCKSLESVHITYIAAWCGISFVDYFANPLYYAHNLYLNGELVTDLVIPDSVTKIRNFAFRNCSSLTSVTIGDGVTSIGYEAFSGCTSLTSITIPDSVTEIGGSAFSDCTSLKEVYCKPTTPPVGGDYMFDNNASGRKIYVPTESVDAYNYDWSDYKSYIYGYDF